MNSKYLEILSGRREFADYLANRKSLVTALSRDFRDNVEHNYSAKGLVLATELVALDEAAFEIAVKRKLVPKRDMK